MKLCEFGRKTLNFALPTGGPEITEILENNRITDMEQIYWNTDTRTHIHSTKSNENDHFLLQLNSSYIPPVCIDVLTTEMTYEKPQNSPPQRPDPSQVAVTCRGSRSSP